MGMLQRSWALTKQALAVVAENPELLIFPLLSGFILFVIDAPFLPQLARLSLTKPSLSLYGTLVALYCASDFVIIFFNSALMATVAMLLEGKEVDVADGLRAAARWIVEILAWSLIAGTAGLLIQVLENRLDRDRRWIGRVVDTAWTMATFFIIPVIIFEGQSDIRALRRSAELFKQQWGTEAAGRLGLSLVFLVAAIPAVMLSLFVGLFAHGAAIMIAGASFLLLYLVHEAAEGVFVVALYRYATTGAITGGFTPDVMQAAFVPKDAGWTEVELPGQAPAEHRLGTWRDFQARYGSGGGATAEPPADSGSD
jgi:hypothetical protein